MTDSSSDTLSLDYSFHHGSHRQLLEPVSASEVPGARVDAIIVPAARPVDALNDALALARDLNCGVVALCSNDLAAVQAAGAGDAANVPVIALDVQDGDYGLPSFETARVPAAFTRPSDTSLKRNLGLVLAKVAGWERVLFLDDDIKSVTASGARVAAALTDKYDVVGLENKGYPDNSVVCHTYRDLEKGGQAQFIGVGAMALNARSNSSFFPNIYNQDWMFMLGHGFPPRLAVTGRMKQEPYDPYADRDRARREEFGDCIAEGLYWLLDNKGSIERADIDHWTTFLDNRSYFIDHLIARVTASRDEEARVQRVLDSLRIAQETTSKVTPEACVEFMDRWHTDLTNWREFVAQLPVDLGAVKALEQLSWPGVVQSDRVWPDIPDTREDRLIFPNGRNISTADQQAGQPPDRAGQSPQLAPRIARGGAAG